MKVKIRKPNIQVLLHKVVTRTSATGSAQVNATQSQSSLAGPPSQSDSAKNIYDLTTWLGEGSVVRVQKSVRASAGAFSISFVDQVMNGLKDTLYALIEPMDMIEIRFAGDSYKYSGATGQKLPVMMRGFVADIQRDQSMGADGKPRRTIHVTGHDYHKILQIIQIFNMPATPDVANLISSFPLFSKYGPELNVQTTTAFVQAVFDLIVNPYIAGMQQAGATSGTALAEVATDIQVPDALVSVQLGAFNNGTVQQLLEQYLDLGPFNEFFIEDRDAGVWGPAGPYAVYRPTPFLDAAQRLTLQPIQSSVTSGIDPSSDFAPTANCVSIGVNSIISISARRSDAGVANYFWVDAPRFTMNYDDLTKMFATYASQQGGATETNAGNGTPAGDARWANQNAFLTWIDNRRNLLTTLNQDNVVLESGAMHLEGHEKIRAGTYVQINYGDQIQSLHYAHSVVHTYEPFGNYFTEVDYERGTNFIDRITAAQSSGSPYFSEMLTPGSQ